MVNLLPKKRRVKEKSPEIERFKVLLKALGIKVFDLANETGIAERTINNFIWMDLPIGPHLLRELHSKYNVSLDWLLDGHGTMFLSGAAEPVGTYTVATVENARANRMIGFIRDFMASASDDEQAWLETQLKLHVPQYAKHCGS